MGRHNRLPDRFIVEAWKLRRAGYAIRDIADYFDVSEAQIWLKTTQYEHEKRMRAIQSSRQVERRAVPKPASKPTSFRELCRPLSASVEPPETWGNANTSSVGRNK